MMHMAACGYVADSCRIFHYLFDLFCHFFLSYFLSPPFICVSKFWNLVYLFLISFINNSNLSIFPKCNVLIIRLNFINFRFSTDFYIVTDTIFTFKIWPIRFVCIYFAKYIETVDLSIPVFLAISLIHNPFRFFRNIFLINSIFLMSGPFLGIIIIRHVSV